MNDLRVIGGFSVTSQVEHYMVCEFAGSSAHVHVLDGARGFITSGLGIDRGCTEVSAAHARGYALLRALDRASLVLGEQTASNKLARNRVLEILHSDTHSLPW